MFKHILFPFLLLLLPADSSPPCTQTSDKILWCDNIWPELTVPDRDTNEDTYGHPQISLAVLSGFSHVHEDVRHAMLICRENLACVQAVLYKNAVSPMENCWICKNSAEDYLVTVLSYNMIGQFPHGQNPVQSCMMPHAMLWLLKLEQTYWKDDFSLFPPERIDCNDTSKLFTHNQTFMVPIRVAGICICSEGENKLGYSMCKVEVHITNISASLCQIVWKNGTRFTFKCPFENLFSSEDLFWICGKFAFSKVPPNWQGCCYPAVIGSSLIAIRENLTFGHHEIIHDSMETPFHDAMVTSAGEMAALHTDSQLNYTSHRMKRALPAKYRGYVLASTPWTTQGETIGWSIFIGAGQSVAFFEN